MDYSRYEAEIYAKLQPPGDPSHAAFMKNYMNLHLEFLAIKVPVMRQVMRKAMHVQGRMAAKRLEVDEAKV